VYGTLLLKKCGKERYSVLLRIASAPRPLTMKPILTILLLALALMGALYLSQVAAPVSPQLAPVNPVHPDGAPTHVSPVVSLERDEDADDAGTSVARTVPMSSATDAETAHAEALQPQSDATIVGRLLLPDGSPAKDANWKLSGWERHDHRGRGSGLPASWKDQAGLIGHDELFNFRIADPTQLRIALSLDSPSHCGESWLWEELKGGSRIDLDAHYHDTGAFEPIVPLPRSEADGTLADGSRELVHGLVPGNLTLLVSAPGMATAAVELGVLSPNEIRPVSIQLSPAALIAGRFFELDGVTPIAGATVQLAGPDSRPVVEFKGSSSDPSAVPVPPLKETMTDAEGRYQFESLAAGLFRVHAYPNVYVAASRDIALREGEQSSDFDLVLENAASLDVECVGSPGKTLEGFELSLRFVGQRAVHAH
jgi:hypothetical protein